MNCNSNIVTINKLKLQTDLQFFFFTCQSGHEGSEKELKYTSAKGFLKIMVVQKKKTTFDHWTIFPFLEW